MPFVNVWIDDCDCDCEDGAEVERLKSQIDEALIYLDAGLSEEATAVLRNEPRWFAPINELKHKYDNWKSGRLDGFAPPYRVKEE